MSDERRFGRYRVTRTLGEGAMGEVYEAIDDTLGREVAIKTLKSRSGAFARLYDERFRQEARAIAQLSHPNVVQVFDLDLAADPPFLVMERVAGPPLDDVLERGPVSIEMLIPLGIQIARALAAAHAAGIVHRDVKPANILGAGLGAWKLADFGVARVPDSSLTITGQFVGSPAYAAPEALVQGISEPAGDVYALGATLYEAVAGKWPRIAASGALLAPVPPLRDHAPHVSRAVAAAIDRAVAFDASARPTAAELAELLAHAASADPLAHPPAARVRWKPWAIGAALLLVVAIVAEGRDGARHDDAGTRDAIHDDTGAVDDDSARDWQHVRDEVDHGHYDQARHHLDDWERRYGSTPDSRELREHLDDEGPERGPPGHRPKHSKHD